MGVWPESQVTGWLMMAFGGIFHCPAGLGFPWRCGVSGELGLPGYRVYLTTPGRFLDVHLQGREMTHAPARTPTLDEPEDHGLFVLVSSERPCRRQQVGDAQLPSPTRLRPTQTCFVHTQTNAHTHIHPHPHPHPYPYPNTLVPITPLRCQSQLPVRAPLHCSRSRGWVDRSS
ncbi:hypothetical protein LZ31DRAFT_217260 [Colletotrichum somersetense]|nr:hypothetical protein LZ31DRAFT_217260 [Colletotrichum somersetense]